MSCCSACFGGRAPVYRSHHFDSTRWEHIKPRPDDIIIVTAYKSGTTWMQQVVSELLFQGQVKPAANWQMSPWVDLATLPLEDVVAGLEGQQHRRFMKTHMPADAFAPYMYPGQKFIYVGREGKDAFMSLMNHYEKGNEMWYNAMNEGLPDELQLPKYGSDADSVPKMFDLWLSKGWHTLPETDGYPFWSLLKNVRTWWRYGKAHPDRVLFVHFNNMLADLEGEMLRVAKFLDIEVDRALLPGMVKACTFESMKANSSELAPAGGVLWSGGGSNFIFKGTNDRWKGVLSEKQVAAYDEKVARVLPRACAKWLATGIM